MLRFILYLTCMSSLCAAAVLVGIIHKYNKKEQRNFVVNFAGMLCCLMIASTSYYLSEFSALLGGKGDYNFAERFLDLLSSFFLFYFWISAIRRETAETDTWISNRSYYRISVFFIGIVYLTYAAAYLFFVDNHYQIVRHNHAVILLQYILTCSITAALLMGIFSLYRTGIRRKKRPMAMYILSVGIVILLMTLYNGIMSLLIFKKQYDFDQWIGNLEFNGELQLATGLLLLAAAKNAYQERVQEKLQSLSQVTSSGKNDSEDARLQTMREYGLSEREVDVAVLLYDKQTYEKIGEMLHISKYTVKRHVHNIYEKLEVSKRSDFIQKLDSQS